MAAFIYVTLWSRLLYVTFMDRFIGVMFIDCFIGVTVGSVKSVRKVHAYTRCLSDTNRTFGSSDSTTVLWSPLLFVLTGAASGLF